MSIEQVKAYEIVCDVCGTCFSEEGKMSTTKKEANKLFKEEPWEWVKKGKRHFCNDCKKDISGKSVTDMTEKEINYYIKHVADGSPKMLGGEK
jgi:hypothetical protein